MNNKLTELFGQALDQTVPHTWTALTHSDLEKFSKVFAELIVRQCAELIDNKEMITPSQTYDGVFVAKYDTKYQCSKQILEHFGVEE